MATKHTEHYQLNLWEPEDKFLRTEFNENFSKLDTAISQEAATAEQAIAKKCGFVKLRELVLTQMQATISLDMSDMDWSKWQYVLLDVDLIGNASMNLYLNGDKSLVSCGSNGTSYANSLVGPITASTTGDGKTRVVFESFCCPARTVTAQRYSYRGSARCTFSQVQTIDLALATSSSGSYRSGTLTLWGFA